MKYNPHDYQKFCIKYLLEHPIAAVFLDCGLGKTSITLAAIKELLVSGEVSKVLVVAPLRVALVSWPDEIEKWEEFKNLKYSVINGTPAKREKALEADADIYIVNRENLKWLIDSGHSFDYDMVVLDELSSFKSWSSQRFKAFMKVRPTVKRVVGLTGTPSSNGLMDLFAEYKCLDMGERLGRYISQYRVDYFVPDRYNGPIVYSYKLKPHAEKWIYSRISDITISMKSMDYLKMPELISRRYSVKMSGKEQELYDQLKQDLFLPYDDEECITAGNAASLTNKLSQMGNGCVYSDNKAEIHIHDRKLDALEDLIEAANGKPVLVVYWYKHDLRRIQERLDKLKINYQKVDSPESIRAWNEGILSVGLMHPASVGHGVNLQKGGNTLIFFGLTWSLELYQQTIARLWRQGQESSTVVVQHIVTEGTIDEKILKALESKNATQSELIDAVKAQIGRIVS